MIISYKLYTSNAHSSVFVKAGWRWTFYCCRYPIFTFVVSVARSTGKLIMPICFSRTVWEKSYSVIRNRNSISACALAIKNIHLLLPYGICWACYFPDFSALQADNVMRIETFRRLFINPIR